MNFKFAPDWQWTCSAPQTGQAGTVRDQTFQEYAQYLARVVSYYNRGSMVTETGTTITNPAARSNPQSPIYGMPILDVDHSRSIIVMKRSMRPGYAGNG